MGDRRGNTHLLLIKEGGVQEFTTTRHVKRERVLAPSGFQGNKVSATTHPLAVVKSLCETISVGLSYSPGHPIVIGFQTIPTRFLMCSPLNRVGTKDKAVANHQGRGLCNGKDNRAPGSQLVQRR